MTCSLFMNGTWSGVEDRKTCMLSPGTLSHAQKQTFGPNLCLNAARLASQFVFLVFFCYNCWSALNRQEIPLSGSLIMQAESCASLHHIWTDKNIIDEMEPDVNMWKTSWGDEDEDEEDQVSSSPSPPQLFGFVLSWNMICLRTKYESHQRTCRMWTGPEKHSRKFIPSFSIIIICLALVMFSEKSGIIGRFPACTPSLSKMLPFKCLNL